MTRNFQTELFYYEEAFTENQINQVKLPEQFFISEEIRFPILLARLFLGNIGIRYSSEKLIKVDTDVFSKFPFESSQDFHKNKKTNLKTIIKDLSFEEEEILKSLTVHSVKNKDLYKDLVFEISCYLYYSSKGSYTTAFLHLYRCYEYISYSFPLTYIQGQNSFQGSYDELQSFFGGNNGGELKFFQKFILDSFLENNYFSDSIYLNKIEINFLQSDFTKIQSIWKPTFQITNDSNKKVYKKFLKDNSLPSKDIFFEFNQNNSSLEIDVLLFHDFFITVRNKSFHYLSGRPNKMQFNNMLFDTFFEYINPHIYNWIANIYKHILYGTFNKQ